MLEQPLPRAGPPETVGTAPSSSPALSSVGNDHPGPQAPGRIAYLPTAAAPETGSCSARNWGLAEHRLLPFGKLNASKPLEPSDKSEHRYTAAANPAPPVCQQSVKSVVLGDVENEQRRRECDDRPPTVPSDEDPVDGTPQAAKGVSDMESDSGNEEPERIPPLLPGCESDAVLRSAVEVGQPRGAHVPSVSGDPGRQRSPPFGMRLPLRLYTNQPPRARTDDTVSGRNVVVCHHPRRLHLGENVVEAPLCVGFSLAFRTGCEVPKHTFPGVGAKLSIHKLGQAITEVALPSGRPLAIAP